MKGTAIVFDFFGVISSEVAPFWFGERFPEVKARELKEKYMSPADRGDVDEAALFAMLGELTGEAPEDIERDFTSRAVINRDMLSLIERLRENNTVALLSNALASWLHRILLSNDLYRLFDAMVISGEEGVIKPEREIFELLISRLGIEPSSAVFIDDNPKNVEAARAVGLRGIVFTGVSDLERELSLLGIEF